MVIASLRGIVQSTSLNSVVLDVSGVGYLVQIIPSLALNAKAGDELFLNTAFVVREDAFTIFGFQTTEELSAFELLRSVTGVGPKSALSIIHQLGVELLGSAVMNEDDNAFKQVSGIGPKTAKLIVVTLAGKIGGTGNKGLSSIDSEIVAALVGLGYAPKAADQAVTEARVGLKDGSKEDLLRRSLALLGTR